MNDVTVNWKLEKGGGQMIQGKYRVKALNYLVIYTEGGNVG